VPPEPLGGLPAGAGVEGGGAEEAPPDGGTAGAVPEGAEPLVAGDAPAGGVLPLPDGAGEPDEAPPEEGLPDDGGGEVLPDAPPEGGEEDADPGEGGAARASSFSRIIAWPSSNPVTLSPSSPCAWEISSTRRPSSRAMSSAVAVSDECADLDGIGPTPRVSRVLISLPTPGSLTTNDGSDAAVTVYTSTTVSRVRVRETRQSGVDCTSYGAKSRTAGSGLAGS